MAARHFSSDQRPAQILGLLPTIVKVNYENLFTPLYQRVFKSHFMQIF